MEYCNIYRPTVVKIYEAVISTYSGSLMLNIKADDGTVSTINLSTQTLRFASGSGAHGFGFRVSGTSLLLETPQPLTSGSNVIFNKVTAGSSVFQNNTIISGSITAEKIYSKNKFVLLNSGSSTGDGGIIIRSGSNYSGVGLGYDESAKRFGIQINSKLHPSSSMINPEAYIPSVLDIDGGQTETEIFRQRGNIRISGSSAYIYI